METIFTETWAGKTEYWTCAGKLRVTISYAMMRAMTRQGARLIRLNA